MAPICARPGCGRTASAVLVYDYARQRAWFADPTGAGSSGWQLCRAHAAGVRPPRGWTLDPPAEARTEVVVPAPQAPAPAPPTRPEPVAEPVPLAWSPRFDLDDDAGGLLRARTPLLQRAFGLT